MAALTFDDLPAPQPLPEGRPRVQVNTGPKSNALTFDDVTAPRDALQTATGWGKAAVSGLDKGVAGLAGLPADLALGSVWLLNWASSKAQGRSFEEVEAENDRKAIISRDTIRPWGAQAITAASPLQHKPETTTEKYIDTAMSFVPGAVAPGVAAGRLANIGRDVVRMGIAPGVVSEAAGQATEGTAMEPWARGLTALGTGAVGAWVNAPNAAGSVVTQAARGATPAQIDAAEQLFRQAQQAGVPITRAEAVQYVTGGATNLGNLQRVVEGSGQMQPFFAQRPGQVEAATRQQIGQTLGQAAPDPYAIGPQVGQAAEGVVQDTRNAINARTRPLYQAADVDRVPPAQYQRLAQDPSYDAALQTIRNHPELGPQFNHLPDNSVTVVDAVKKLLNTRADVTPNADATERYLASLRGTAETNARTAGTASSPAYAQALAEQARLRQQYLEPLLAGPLGKLAKTDMATDRAIRVLFPENPLPGGENQIGGAITALATRQPGATRQLVRAHVERTFNEAVQLLQSGANQFGGAGFVAALRGNPQQAANFEAALTDRFLQILEAQGTRQRQGSQTAFNQEVQAGLKQGGTVAEALTGAATGGIKVPQQISDAIQRMRLGQNTREIADLLTNPDAAALFRQLATAPPNSAKATAIATRLFYMATQDARTREKK